MREQMDLFQQVIHRACEANLKQRSYILIGECIQPICRYMCPYSWLSGSWRGSWHCSLVSTCCVYSSDRQS